MTERTKTVLTRTAGILGGVFLVLGVAAIAGTLLLLLLWVPFLMK
jgi:hypothetical protein